jgi:RecA-family ATPase
MNNAQNPLLDAALEYAARGWPVFPCCWIENGRGQCGSPDCSPGKNPLTPAGLYDASIDPLLIRAWWKKYPNANIAIRTGAVSHIVAVDADDKSAFSVLKEMFPGGYNFETIPRQKTGKEFGWHLLFSHPGVPVKNAVGFRPGLDARGDNGYIMAAPSIHLSGRFYEWKYLPSCENFPPLPENLLVAINGNGHERLDTAKLLKGVQRGTKRVTAFRLASKFRRVDIPLEYTEELILKFARNCTPPLTEREALAQARSAYRRYEPSPDEVGQEDGSLVELMTNIEEQDLDWLWTNRIARGKLTMFEGDPEIGKSYVCLAIAAGLSNGQALPFDSEPEAPLRSLIISREDNPADTIKPRLRLLGADMEMIAVPHKDRSPSLDPNYLSQVLEEWPAAFVVIDPIIALAAGKNTDRAADVRQLLDPLVDIAARYNTAMVLVRHLNKAAGMKALYRGQGSIDFSAVCRSVFTFGYDPDNPGRRLMTHTKGSISSRSKTIEYFLTEEGGFRWGGQSDETADEILGAGESKVKREAKELEIAKQFLHEILAAGAMPSETVKERGKARGIAARTLWRAKTEIGVAAKKMRMTGEWLWRLP